MNLLEAIKQIKAYLNWAGKETIADRVELCEIFDWLKELKALRRLCELEKKLEQKESTRFSSEEKEILALSLAMRRNLIETGDPVLSSVDIGKGHKGEVRALSPDQMRTILKVRDLEHKVWNYDDDPLLNELSER
jgi:RIO-like serine/threonine protein kinase